MTKLIVLCVVTLLSTPALAAPPPHVQAKKQAHEAEKAARKDEKERRKAEREYVKDRRKAERERQKAMRKAHKIRARQGWYDGSQYREYQDDFRYRNDQYEALRHYPPPADYRPPDDYKAILFEVGMDLAQGYLGEESYLDARRYGLPPAPDRHRWVQVDDDVVLIEMGTRMVADFVYDLFEQ